MVCNAGTEPLAREATNKLAEIYMDNCLLRVTVFQVSYKLCNP